MSSNKLDKLDLDIQSTISDDAILTISGCPSDLHKSPEKIKQLLDILELPEGTEVKVTIKASSSVVR